jgi:hypothetical protein
MFSVDKGIHPNGLNKYAHEDFILQEGFVHDFCKTFEKLYEIVVTVILVRDSMVTRLDIQYAFVHLLGFWKITELMFSVMQIRR